MSKIIKDRENDLSSYRIELLSLRSFMRTEGQQDAPYLETDYEKIKTESQAFILQARTQAAQAIEAAQKQAEGITGEAIQKAEQYKKEARDAGYQEGLLQAEVEVEKKYEAIFDKELARLKSVIEVFNQSYRDLVKSSEMPLVKLALDVARKVIKQEADKDNTIVLNSIHEALSRVVEKGKIVVRINPEQFDFIKENKGKVIAALEGIDGFELFEDAKVDKGGCIIETETGSVEARLDRQLQEIKKVLTGEDKEEPDVSNNA